MSENDREAEGGEKPHSEPEARSESQEAPSGPGNLTLSANDFSALEQRILRAVDVVRRERLARNLAEERATRAEAQMREQLPLMEQLEKDLNALRAERDHVRERVERLLGQLDALEL
jgi:FtsZ-binding cell division protein ZapB